MSTAVGAENRIRHIVVTDETITADLVDGRVISVPLSWSWRLTDATAAQRDNWQLLDDGRGVHWPDIDEDLSVEGMLNGVPARRSVPTETGRRPHQRARRPTSHSRRRAKPKPRSRVTRH